MWGNRSLKRKLKRLAHGDVDDELLSLLADGSRKERMDIANALWGCADQLSREDRALVVSALEAASHDPAPDVRANAIAALLELGAPGAEDLGRAALGDMEWIVRTLVAAQLGHCGGRDSGPYLLPLLKDPVPMVRVQAAGALRNLRYVEAVPALEEMVRIEKDSDAKEAATEALADLRTLE